MDRLRRIIIHKSENGYMFSIKDLGHPYSEAAPVNRVASNGPADCAGLRSGDGVVAINSNLVKGRSYTDLCNIIKSSRGTSLELTVIESYCLSTLPQNKQSQDERQMASNHSTPLPYEESSAQKYSPILIKKKAYTYDKEILETFSLLSVDDPKSSNSANELSFDHNEVDMNEDASHLTSGRYKAAKPRISYKRATNNVYKTTAKSDLDLNTSAAGGRGLSTKGAQFEPPAPPPSKVFYHQAYKQLSVSGAPNSRSVTESQQSEFSNRHRRGSTPVISDSSSLTTVSKDGQYSQPKTAIESHTTSRSRKTSRNLLMKTQSKANSQSSGSPILQLNRVGGLVRAPLSVDETFDLDDDCGTGTECLEDMLDTATTTDYSSATAATTESGRSSCDLDVLDSGSKTKFRHIHCSPMPYKSHAVQLNPSLPFEITPTSELFQIPKFESPKLKETLLNVPVSKSSPCSDTNSLTDIQEPSYQQTESYHDGLIEDVVQDKDSSEVGEDCAINHNFKHFKKIKNIFGENYRCRSKTLDSDGKLEDDDIDLKVQPVSVLVKWIMYEGKTCKNSWKQYMMNIDDDRLVFCREKSQNYHKSTSLEDVTMCVSMLNAIVEDEPEKRGRKNTIRLVQADRQSECLIEYPEKSIAINWLRIIIDRSKADKDDRGSRNTSFKERHSLTVPNLFGNQGQFSKSKSKLKDGNASPNQSNVAAASLSTTPSNKGVLHQAMSRVKNLKHKFASSGQVSDFERQQEEWHNKIAVNSISSKLVTSSSYNDDIQSGLEGAGGSGQSVTGDCKTQMTISEVVGANMLPLHKWQRSNVSHLVPLVVELCVSIIETFGMNLVGLYRVSGNKVALDFITAELHKPILDIDVNTDKWNDLHAISGVLKSFFRNLPDGLFPKDLYSDIIGACRMHEFDRIRRLLSIQRFLSIMDIVQDHPEYRYHRETLRYLAEHLSRVASRHSINKMNAKNLAVIFAPSLIIPPLETNQMLVNDYKYKIQLIETLIKYHKWLFSPTLESACNIPTDSDDEDYMRNAFPSEDILPDQLEVVESWTQEVTDARPLVKKVLSRATKIVNESPGNVDKTSLNFSEYGNESHLTLAELSRQAYAFNSIDGGYKEVDIDEECERRKIRVETSAIDQLKTETEKILSECSKDIEELNGIQHKCHQDLSEVQLKIKEVDDEILKTELFLENTKGNTGLPRNTASQLFAISSPVYGPQLPVSESHKS